MEVFSDLYSSFKDVWSGTEELNLCKGVERLIKNNYIDFISYFQKLKIHTFTNWTTAKICFKIKHAAKKGIRPFESTALLKNNKGRSDNMNHIYVLPGLSTPLQRLNKAFDQIYSFFQVHRLSLLTLHGVRGWGIEAKDKPDGGLQEVIFGVEIISNSRNVGLNILHRSDNGHKQCHWSVDASILMTKLT